MTYTWQRARMRNSLNSQVRYCWVEATPPVAQNYYEIRSGEHHNFPCFKTNIYLFQSNQPLYYDAQYVELLPEFREHVEMISYAEHEKEFEEEVTVQ